MRKIAVSGASGFVGRALCEFLRELGFRVRPLVRPGARAEDGIAWDPRAGTIDLGALEGLDAIVHLAGEPISDARWTEKKKTRIRDSRVRGTALLAVSMARLSQKPRVFVSGSAIGYYGDCANAEVDESAPRGRDFLAEVAEAWENAAAPAHKAGVRVVHPRLGIVLGPEGGALGKALLPFKLGLGGPLGGGQQAMSWVALIDVVRAITHLIEHDEIRGPVNVTSPQPSTNEEFTRILGAVLQRPTVLRLPKTMLRLALGEMADQALLSGVRVMPTKLLATGFQFEQPDLARFLASALA